MSESNSPNRATQALATAGRILGGADVPVYTIQHLVTTQKHKAGEVEKIVVPYIELGRASTSVVRFGDDCPTVSRKHAAIVREGKEVKIKNLSQTNPTLVNGRTVTGEWTLQNGDEIQLSQNGPKMLFNTTATGTARMGFTGKMNLVVAQAIKPYRSIVVGLFVALLAIVGIGGWLIFGLNQKNAELAFAMNQQKEISTQQAKALEEANARNTELQGKLDKVAQNLEKKLKANKQYVVRKTSSDAKYSKPIDVIKPFSNDVFLLTAYQIVVTPAGGEPIVLDGGWSGTGFLCEDGRFVTAHHCVNGWFYSTDDVFLQMNAIAMNGGKVVAKIKAVSPDGRTLNFTSDQFTVDLSGLQRMRINLDDQPVVIALGNTSGAQLDGDWAYIQTNQKGKINYTKAISENVPQGDQIYILGYPHGTDHVNESKLQPLYCTTTTAQDGLTKGMINTTNRGFDHGNSGGPCFWIDKDGKAYAVGIVSASPSDASPIGMLVPMSALK